MRASLVALALAACASRVAAQTFSAAQLAAAKPWQFETKEEGQARAHRLRKGHPALRRALFQTWQQDFGTTYTSPAHQVSEVEGGRGGVGRACGLGWAGLAGRARGRPVRLVS